MESQITIAVDALGGDHAPQAVLDGVTQALADDKNLQVILCGPEEVVGPFCAKQERCLAMATTEVIEMAEHPAEAVRTKKNSSLVVCAQLVKEGRAQGFFSAGNTGACLAAATLVIGRIKGIKRPALGQVLPSYQKPTLLIDVGANADCKPDYLPQFGTMGAIYMKEVMGVAAPEVALLNIGEEETKGNELALKAYPLMKEQLPEFIGNVEGRDVLAGVVDVIVTDGFTGNVTLKTLEGTAKVLFKYVKDALMTSFKTKMGAALIKSDLTGLKDRLSPDAFGGAPLLGVKGACIVGHGSSNALAIKNGIRVTAATARGRVADLIAQAIATQKDAS